MNYNKKTVKDVDVKGKKVLLRCDFNVPQDKVTGEITSDKRIKAALPTIQYLLDNGAAVIACSHLGKPKGVDPKFTLAPVAVRLGELLGKDVIMAKDVAGDDAKAKAAALQPGQIMLLENTRFEKGETKNDPELAKAMASMADLFVSDAFGSVHRAHASTAGVADYLPAVSGFLIQKELQFLGGAISNPKRPLVAILGGSKVSSKIGVINNLLEIADTIIIGGGMSYTFSAAQGGKVGDSLLEKDWLDYSNDMMKKAADKGVKFLLPVDTVAADKYAPDANSQVVKDGEIPDGWMGLDIGPETIKLYCDAVAGAGTVIW
ncbi:MAG: phosphoglycerate kinase, partial [Oscillibacter sp.]|nr:phosphoglycerate kinase [Oscillibacter sp.]